MFGRNVDFVAVLFITLVMLGAGLGAVLVLDRSLWIRFASKTPSSRTPSMSSAARCRATFLSNLSCILHRLSVPRSSRSRAAVTITI